MAKIWYIFVAHSFTFFQTTAVAMAEVVKLLTCLILVYREEKSSLNRWKTALYTTIVVNKLDTLKVGIPSFLYLVQNNLLYVAAGHLDVATYQENGSKTIIFIFNNYDFF